MQRRSFVASSAAGLVGATLAAPAIAQTLPNIRWRLASSYPKSLDTVFGGSQLFAERVKQLTEGKFIISVHAAGELMPALQVLDGVSNGTVEMCHTNSYYYVGKNLAFAFETAVPFGLNSRQQTAWMLYGDGLKLTREFMKEYNVINFPGGNTGAQMGGWLRKEINKVDDLKGLKFRIAGFSGVVLAKLGVIAQQIPGGEIYQALERGTIDGAEWIGPYDDEKLGFGKVAKYYYYPGFWEGSSQFSFFVNIKEWEKLPAMYKEAISTAAMEAHVNVQAEYDAKNPAALARLVGGGTQLKQYPREILQAAFKATVDACEEEAGKNAAFKKIYEPWKRFRNTQNTWYRLAESTFSSFNVTAQWGS